MMKWLTENAARSEITLTVCTGAFPLAKAGLFDGLTITTFFNAIEALRTVAPRARRGRSPLRRQRPLRHHRRRLGRHRRLHVTARLLGHRVADTTLQQALVYNLACAYALGGKRTDALRTVKRALAMGVPLEQAIADPDLASIHAELGRGRAIATDASAHAPRVN